MKFLDIYPCIVDNNKEERKGIIKKYGHLNLKLEGKNQLGEKVIVLVNKQRIIMAVFLYNGIIKRYAYNKDGEFLCCCPVGIWKEPKDKEHSFALQLMADMDKQTMEQLSKGGCVYA